MTEYQFIQQILRDVWDYVRTRHLDNASLQVDTKKGDVADLVTESDYEVQRRIEAALQAAFPGDTLVAEEAGKDVAPANPLGRCWILDPIDGTHNFARGMVPAFGVSLAFAEHGKVQAAGIALPGLNETFLAQRGGGATRNGRPARVSQIDNLAACRLEIDFSRLSKRDHTLAAARDLLAAPGQLRAHGSCIVSMAAVAAGAAEAYVHGGPQPWDYAAGWLIIEEAGGRVTRFDGREIQLFENPPRTGLLATNAMLHEEVRKLIISAMP